jgi:uncharacterized protein YdhG (YjbR/CyaY superfamily)
VRLKATSTEAYLAKLPDDQRAALEKLRKAIKAAAPKAEERVSYGLPAFSLNGRRLVCFGATKTHCAFYPMSALPIAKHQKELAGYDTSKGAIRFQPAKPLPATLVKKLVKTRIAENEK